MNLYDLASAGAFIVADESILEDAVVQISGPYLTVWFRRSATFQPNHEAEWVTGDYSGPWEHGLGNDSPGGIYEADAEELYEAARALLAATASGSLGE